MDTFEYGIELVRMLSRVNPRGPRSVWSRVEDYESDIPAMEACPEGMV